MRQLILHAEPLSALHLIDGQLSTARGHSRWHLILLPQSVRDGVGSTVRKTRGVNPASLQIVQPSEFNQPASVSFPVSNEDDTVEPAGFSQGGDQIIYDK